MAESTQERILIVEDNPDTQMLLRYLLRGQFDVTIVLHIEEALAAASEQTYDLFLLDINLGEQRTGIDLLQLLRDLDGYDTTPALALTAYAMPGDQEHFLGAGFNGYISKPFTKRDLLQAIDTVLASPSRR